MSTCFDRCGRQKPNFSKLSSKYRKFISPYCVWNVRRLPKYRPHCNITTNWVDLHVFIKRWPILSDSPSVTFPLGSSAMNRDNHNNDWMKNETRPTSALYMCRLSVAVFISIGHVNSFTERTVSISCQFAANWDVLFHSIVILVLSAPRIRKRSRIHGWK